VLHTALRAASDEVVVVDGENVVPMVHAVLARMKDFSERVRSGAWLGATGKPLTSTVVIGIGGSYLGPEFVCDAMRFAPDCASNAAGRRLRFLANVDPVDVKRALDGLDPETTLVVVCSKTFTTVCMHACVHRSPILVRSARGGGGGSVEIEPWCRRLRAGRVGIRRRRS
jgi:glucose-6-phosphate isomerase